MDRVLESLASRTFDLVVVGGGIYGAAITWEAASRGLSVALVEREDFGAATSANSLKIIHGGLRYLQHLDLKRLRRSARERMNLMRIAPHLVHPLPTLVPTYGHGMKGREAMTLALSVYDLLTLDRNRLEDPQKHIPRGRIVTAEACRELLPGIPDRGLNGGAIYYDAQAYNTERLVLAFVKSAYRAGAVVANYSEVTGLLQRSDAVHGVNVCDRLSGDILDVRATLTVNAAGPWAGQLLDLAQGCSEPGHSLAKAFNVIARPLFETYAVGLPSRRPHADIDAVFKTGARLFFIAPWRQKSILGTAYVAYEDPTSDVEVSEQEVAEFLEAFNHAMPDANLSLGDVSFVHGGLLPTSGIDTRTGRIQMSKRPVIRDHRRDGIEGLISVFGVKYTTARAVAEKTVDRVLDRWAASSVPSDTAFRRLVGGDIDRFEDFVKTEKREDRFNAGPHAVELLIANYGSEYRDVLRHRDVEYNSRQDVVRAQVAYAVEEEMACTLMDVVLRRTELGTAGHPGHDVLHFCASVMAKLLDWDADRVHDEIERVEAAYPSWLPVRNDDTDGELANSAIQ